MRQLQYENAEKQQYGVRIIVILILFDMPRNSIEHALQHSEGDFCMCRKTSDITIKVMTSGIEHNC